MEGYQEKRKWNASLGNQVEVRSWFVLCTNIAENKFKVVYMQKWKSVYANAQRRCSAREKVTLGQVVLEMGSCILGTISVTSSSICQVHLSPLHCLDKIDSDPKWSGVSAFRHNVLISPPSARISREAGWSQYMVCVVRDHYNCPSPVTGLNRDSPKHRESGVGVEVRLKRASCVSLITPPCAHTHFPLGFIWSSYCE